jgi:NADH:ubiquinone oxidoreductase subunit 5 (subunit L)/multisubunit Na+/H+ antiporter MnhA subunit
MTWIIPNLWLIPALPLLAAGLSAVTPRSGRRFAASLAIGSMTLAFVLSCWAFAQTLGEHGEAARQVHNFDWFALGEATLKLGWMLDPLTAAMLVMITFVGGLIFIYSVGYMAHDDNFTRFFCFLSLFAAAMLGVVLANSLLLLFICWELVGFASYILIGFWYHKPSAAAAAKKAFITTRVGDVFFFLGMVWLYAETGTLLFYDNGAGCLEQSALSKLLGQTTFIGMGVSTAISLLIFCGAIGKSGQVPLHVWLPDAMEGPTPVSALIHAATMVAAGVFLVARVYPLMEVVPAVSANSASVAMAEQTLTPALSMLAVSPSPLNGERAGVRGENGLEPPDPDDRSLTDTRHSERSVELTGSILRTASPLTLALSPLRGEGKGYSTLGDAFGPRRFFATALSTNRGEGRAEGERSLPPVPVSTSLRAVTWVGAITAVFAALIAVAQSDIKRILAYSTVSQLGYMMMGLGVGGVAVGLFHLLTHAFFKALLFLGAGSVIHGCHGEQDIRRMGGLRPFMPVTFFSYAVGMMALAGVPLVFSGFWSKDEILHAAWFWQPSKWPFALGVFGALLTAFYMTRQVCYVFLGPDRRHRLETGDAEIRSPAPPHESPRIMTIPLAVLAVCTVVLSAFATPVFPWFHSYLSGHAAHLQRSVEIGLLLTMLLSTFIVTAGLGAGWWLYGRNPVTSADEPDALERLKPEWFSVLRGKFFIDELYEMSVVRFNAWSAGAARWLDEKLWDGVVSVVSYAVLAFSWLSRLIDEFIVNLGFDQGCDGLRLGARLLSLWQNGQVQRYLRVIALALAVFALVFMWGCK